MKKVLVIVLLLSLLICVCACNSNAEEEPSSITVDGAELTLDSFLGYLNNCTYFAYTNWYSDGATCVMMDKVQYFKSSSGIMTFFLDGSQFNLYYSYLYSDPNSATSSTRSNIVKTITFYY